MEEKRFNRIHGLAGLAISLVSLGLCIANIFEIRLPQTVIALAIIITAIAAPILIWSIVRLLKNERRNKKKCNGKAAGRTDNT